MVKITHLIVAARDEYGWLCPAILVLLIAYLLMTTFAPGLSATTKAAAKRFFQKALRASGHPRPRVINVDGNPSYPKVVAELRAAGELARRCRCRTCPYLNNIVEQDHRAIKRRVNASQGFRSFRGASRTIQGYEAVNMIRKGQVSWLPKGDVVINETLGLRAE